MSPIQPKSMRSKPRRCYDMGKLAVPEYILNKPGPHASRIEKMKMHASVGADILSAIEFLLQSSLSFVITMKTGMAPAIRRVFPAPIFPSAHVFSRWSTALTLDSDRPHAAQTH